MVFMSMSTSIGRIPTTMSSTIIVHECSFHSIGPRIWNNLPETVINTTSFNAFKSQLKTFLFKTLL